MRLAPGTSIDRYVVEHLLGEGAMAEVYCVRHDRLGSRHALKVLSHPSPYLAARLLKEGRAQSQLQHPHLLPVRDILDLQGRPALLMPLVQGPSLDALLRTYRPTEAEALALFRCIVEGLSFAHQRGVVHRDLKPANVLLEVRLGLVCPLVADFGLVKMDEEGGDKTREGTAIGTPAYAAPEQLRDASRATHRADLFSLGVMLAELLTGTRPFAAGPIAQILDAHRLPPQLGDLAGSLRELIEDLLRMDPAARPASCEAVLARLPDTSSADRSGPTLLTAMRQAAERPAEPERTSAPTDTLVPPSPRHNLTPSRDRFVGRRPEIAALRRSLSEGQRLVTLLGTGGIGKSRLSLELGWEMLHHWPGGVWFCELAEARTAEGIVTAMANSLDVALGKDPEAQLADVILGRGPALFILDNFEQIAPFAARTVGRWMDRAPEAHFVVTSREVLRLRGERVVTLDVLEEDEAASLFVERARQADDRIELVTKDQPAVRTLVALLDRLPLAIELAAARSRLLSLPELVSRMAQRFKLLTSRSADRPSRQQTLLAALEWSWELLEPHERAALAQCSVFEGGFTLEAAESVIEVEGERWVEEVLAELVDKSLLVTRKGRLSMLTSVQAFAREKLTDAWNVEGRHGRWFARMGAPTALEALHRSGGVERGWALWADRDNLVAATHRALARGDTEGAAGCALAVAEVFEARGPLLDGVELLAAVLGMPSLGEGHRVRLLHRQGVLLRLAGRTAQAEEALCGALDLDRRENHDRLRDRLLLDCGGLQRERGRFELALQHYEEALSLCRGTGNRGLEHHVLIHLGILHFEQSRREVAAQLYDRALALAREAGDRKAEGRVVGNLGNLYREQGLLDVALQHYLQALSIFQEVGDRRSEGVSFGNVGGLYQAQGRLDAALRNIQQALSISREIGDRRFEALALVHRGNAHRGQSRMGEALRDYEQALAIHREIGDRLFEGVVLANLGAMYVVQGQTEQSLDAFRAALVLFSEMGNRVYEGFVHDELGALHLGQGRMEEALEHHERALSIHREVGDRTKEGLALGGMGRVQHARGDAALGRVTLDQGEALLREIGDPVATALFLCDRALFEADDDRREAARAALVEASDIARTLGSGRGFGLERALQAAERRLQR